MLTLVRAVILVLLVGGAVALFARRARLLARMNALGRPVDRSGDVPARVTREAGEVLGQRKLLQRRLPGAMHAMIFWGFLILLTTIAEALGQAIDPGFALPIVGHWRWLGLAQDLLASLVIVGLAVAVWIRAVRSSGATAWRLTGSWG